MEQYLAKLEHVEELLDLNFELVHDCLPSSLRGVHIVPVEMLAWVLAQRVQPIMLVLAPLPAEAVRIRALAARPQRILEPLRQLRPRPRRLFADDFGEGGVEVDDLDVLHPAELIEEICVVDAGAHVG